MIVRRTGIVYRGRRSRKNGTITLEEAADLIGESVGAGCYKNVWEIKGHDDLVLVTSRAQDLVQHAADLQLLEDLGVPTATYIEADQKMAIVKRYPSSWKHGSLQNFWSRKTVDSMVQILRALRHSGLSFDDFQVLIDKDGTLVVNDPLPIKMKNREARWSYEDSWGIEGVIEEVARIWAQKEGGTTADRQAQIDKLSRKNG